MEPVTPVPDQVPPVVPVTKVFRSTGDELEHNTVVVQAGDELGTTSIWIVSLAAHGPDVA